MANSIKLKVSTNRQNIPLKTAEKDPFYVGAEAKVEQLDDGALITLKDRDGQTQARVYNGEKGEKGDKGDKGDSGVSDYTALENKPTLNSFTVEGDKTAEDYRLQSKIEEATIAEIERILYLD